MKLRLFIDECLSPELVETARRAGYEESSCSRDRGLLGLADWQLMTQRVDGDYTLVTHNARDFRGWGADRPGGLHNRQAIHAGLVCLNSHFPMDLARQHRLFGYALDELRNLSDLINQALEGFEDERGEATLVLYEIPPAV